jgi:hypothetical protein
MKLKHYIFTPILVLLNLASYSQNIILASHAKDSLKSKLEMIYKVDQDLRNDWDSVATNFADSTFEYKSFMVKVQETDSVNSIEVMNIIDNYGWLGPETIGNKGNTALFIIIQHSNITVQKKYLPIMRDAYRHRRARGQHLALLEDRVAVFSGEKQIYGSQISTLNGQSKLFPIIDKKNVDKRRAAIGLGPLSEYVKQFGITYP